MLSASLPLPSALADSTANQVSTVLHAVAPLLWPLVVILAILIFHAPLSAAIGRVSQVDIGTTKVILQKQADNAANTAKAVAGPRTGSASSLPAITAAEANATGDPSGSVLTAWRAVEDAARTAVPSSAQGVISPSVPAVVNALTATTNLDSSLVPVAETLESVRSVAAAKPKAISPATAMSFVSAASDLARLIAEVGRPSNQLDAGPTSKPR
jgi:hypothetical protein